MSVETEPTFADECSSAMAELHRLRENLRRLRVDLPDDAEEGAVLLGEHADRLDADADDLASEDADPALVEELRAAVKAARVTIADPADTAPPEWQREAGAAVAAAINKAAQTKDPAHAFDAAKHLAALDPAEYAKGKAALKKVLGRALNVSDLNRAVADARRRRHNVEHADDLPRIAVADKPLRDLSDESLDALRIANRPPTIFVRAGALCRVRSDERGRPLIETLRIEHMRGQLSKAANYVMPTDRGDVHTMPPAEAVADVLARGDWPMPSLEAVTETPTLRPDGTVLQDAGYDESTRLVLHRDPRLVVPVIADHPSGQEVDAARTLLLDELLGDFPFDSHASRANALGLLLTPMVRPAIDGNVPLALIDAPQAGTGKGLLANLVALTATGRHAAMMIAPNREEEWTKTILAELLSGSTVIVLDNVQQRLTSTALEAALTADTFRGRMLGRTEQIAVPQRATWAATGNNLRTGGDLARRCYRIRLDAEHYLPWTRNGFRHPDLLAWATERRGDLIAALLTLARAWWADGQPSADVPTLGSYEAWAHTVGSILAHAQVPGFLTDLHRDQAQADDDAADWTAFLAAWAEHYRDEPTLASTVAAALLTAEGAALRDALPPDLADALDRTPGTASFKTKLGKALGRRRGTRYGPTELRLEQASLDPRGQRVLWRVVSTETSQQPLAGLQGLQGSYPPTPQEIS